MTPGKPSQMYLLQKVMLGWRRLPESSSRSCSEVWYLWYFSTATLACQKNRAIMAPVPRVFTVRGRHFKHWRYTKINTKYNN